MSQGRSVNIPILTYHSVDESHSVISTSPSEFAKQMAQLWKGGWRSVSLSEMTRLMRDEQSFPEKTFVITFDDGYENAYSEAFPVLTQFGFKATIFLITEYCGKLNDWPGHSASIVRRPLLSWSQIQEMHKHGMEFGAHTLSHPDLTKISIQDAEREMISSKAQIQDRLGVEAEFFAYPYGKFNSRVKEIAQQQFLGACSTKLGKARATSDLFLLPRVDMYYMSSERLFSALSTVLVDGYLGFRHVAREMKARFA
jgi:peptidoglycan/xylan/chitin deacetylase (PgdA/CDA1 family)